MSIRIVTITMLSSYATQAIAVPKFTEPAPQGGTTYDCAIDVLAAFGEKTENEDVAEAKILDDEGATKLSTDFVYSEYTAWSSTFDSLATLSPGSVYTLRIKDKQGNPYSTTFSCADNIH